MQLGLACGVSGVRGARRVNVSVSLEASLPRTAAGLHGVVFDIFGGSETGAVVRAIAIANMYNIWYMNII